MIRSQVLARSIGLLLAVATASLLLVSASRASARPRPGVARNAWAEDVTAKQFLDKQGDFRSGHDVVLWFPKDSLTNEQAATIVARLDRGIRAAKKKVGRPDWAVEGDSRVHFYCPATYFISHAPGGNCAFIPLWRMREDQAPWLHESLHLLLATHKGDWLSTDPAVGMRRMPLWLMEGLADALAMQISDDEGLVYFSPLLGGRPHQLDSLAADALRKAPSDSVLAMIGVRGKLPQLFGPDRLRYAVPFYAGAASFTRFIARKHGYRPLLDAIDDFDHETETLTREAGEPLEQLKAEWLGAIGYRAPIPADSLLPPQRAMDEMHGDCDHFAWNMTHEFDQWERPASMVRADTSAEGAPAVRLDEPAKLTLAPHRQVRFIVPLGKEPSTAGTYSGLLRFTPSEDGIYRISAGRSVWIDVVAKGQSVSSQRFEMQTGCRKIFKSLAFPMHAGEPTILQVSGCSLDSLTLLVTRWKD